MVVFSGPAAALTVTPMRLLSSRRASSPYFSVPEESMVAVKAAKSGLCSAICPAPLKVICILTMGSSCRSTSVMVTPSAVFQRWNSTAWAAVKARQAAKAGMRTRVFMVLPFSDGLLRLRVVAVAPPVAAER